MEVADTWLLVSVTVHNNYKYKMNDWIFDDGNPVNFWSYYHNCQSHIKYQNLPANGRAIVVTCSTLQVCNTMKTRGQKA